MMNQMALTVSNLNLSYNQTNQVLKDVNFVLPLAAKAAIVGPNGSGKTSLVKSILGLVPYQSGDIKFMGQDVDLNKQPIAYVPQKNQVNWNFPITVFEVVAMGLRKPKWGFNKLTDLDRIKIDQALSIMELNKLADRSIHQLSGGQKQRVFIARAIAQDADFYLLDEPLTGLDHVSEGLIMEQLDRFKEEKKTSLSVHHDLNTVTKYFDYIIFLNQTIIDYGPMTEKWTRKNLQDTYHSPYLTIVKNIA